MTRYAAMFDRCGASGEGAFGAFVMLGDPDAGRCLDYVDALVEGGADMLEVGIPFSDPIADGPVIQAAAARAMQATVRLADCFTLIGEARRRHPAVPIGVLTYANIVAARGVERFCAALSGEGADSLLVADVPTIEAEPYVQAARTSGLDLVMIAAPNTQAPALERIAGWSSGYVYCVGRAGVTGHGTGPQLNHRQLFDKLRALGAAPPVLGFGISTPAHVAAALAHGAAGIICGSAIVDRIARGEAPASIRDFANLLKRATRHRSRA